MTNVSKKNKRWIIWLVIILALIGVALIPATEIEPLARSEKSLDAESPHKTKAKPAPTQEEVERTWIERNVYREAEPKLRRYIDPQAMWRRTIKLDLVHDLDNPPKLEPWNPNDDQPRIQFVARVDPHDKRYGLWTTNLDGSDPRLMISPEEGSKIEQDLDYDWNGKIIVRSPDGRYVLSAVNSPYHSCFVFDLKTRKASSLIGRDCRRGIFRESDNTLFWGGSTFSEISLQSYAFGDKEAYSHSLVTNNPNKSYNTAFRLLLDDNTALMWTATGESAGNGYFSTVDINTMQVIETDLPLLDKCRNNRIWHPNGKNFFGLSPDRRFLTCADGDYYLFGQWDTPLHQPGLGFYNLIVQPSRLALQVTQNYTQVTRFRQKGEDSPVEKVHYTYSYMEPDYRQGSTSPRQKRLDTFTLYLSPNLVKNFQGMDLRGLLPPLPTHEQVHEAKVRLAQTTNLFPKLRAEANNK